MTGVSGTSKQKTRYHYYQCYNAKRKLCDMPLFSRKTVEDAVINATVELLSDDETIALIANTVANLPIPKNTVIDNLKAEIRELKTKLKNSIIAIEKGVISETVSKNIIEYEQRIPELEKKLHMETILTQPFEISADHVKFFLKHILETKKADERRDLIISTFVRDIVIIKDGEGYNLKINYNYTPQPMQLCSPNTSVVAPRGIEPLTPP